MTCLKRWFQRALQWLTMNVSDAQSLRQLHNHLGEPANQGNELAFSAKEAAVFSSRRHPSLSSRRYFTSPAGVGKLRGRQDCRIQSPFSQVPEGRPISGGLHYSLQTYPTLGRGTYWRLGVRYRLHDTLLSGESWIASRGSKSSCSTHSSRC